MSFRQTCIVGDAHLANLDLYERKEMWRDLRIDTFVDYPNLERMG